MYIKFAIYCGNIIGGQYYDTYEEAERAADFRTRVTNKKWQIKEIICYK